MGREFREQVLPERGNELIGTLSSEMSEGIVCLVSEWTCGQVLLVLGLGFFMIRERRVLVFSVVIGKSIMEDFI